MIRICNPMSGTIDICRLDYLVGTLATAYHGLIISLVMKDFCMTGIDGSTLVKGTILSMPLGDYEASLMYEGKELARSGLKEGYFELEAGSELIAQANNLQVDIIQNGGHIGTFLLKKEKTGGFFSSALELSRDIQGVNFNSLTAPLEARVGLFRKAERLISEILSTKKYWEIFSEEINGFSEDLFWYDRETYSRWYGLLARHSRASAERVGAAAQDRALSNFLSLLELPLEKETDPKRVRSFVDAWLRELKESSLPLFLGAGRAAKALSTICGKFPDADIGPALSLLLASLKKRTAEMPALPEDVLSTLKGVLPAHDLTLLSRYGQKNREQSLREIAGDEGLIARREYAAVLEKLSERGSRLPEGTKMAESFLDIIERNITRETAAGLSRSFVELYSIVAAASHGASDNVTAAASRIVQKFISLDMTVVSETLLTSLERGAVVVRENILLNPEMSTAVLNTGDRKLIAQYTSILKQILVPAPRATGFSHQTWAEVVNPLHLDRLSKFLAILRHGKEDLRDVLIHVICNLFVSGVFIPDDKLFQREVSSYLNAPALRNDFLLNYLLLKKLPVYFNDVGATGRIRDDTTEIDSWGNDTVLYFLRKQVHANASNYNMRLLEAIISSWVYDDPLLLKGSVPEDVARNLDAGLMARYSAIICPLFEALKIFDSEGLHFDRLLSVAENDLRLRVEDLQGPDEARSKVLLLCMIYRGVVRKYSFVASESEKKDVSLALSELVNAVRDLKQKVLLPEKTEPQESLFFKRHIAFGIPSVLGSYHEPKFDALGALFRQEARIRTLLEEMISNIEERGSDFSLNDLKQWLLCLEDMNTLLNADGLGNFQADELVTICKTNRLRLSQIVDMLRMWQRELTWMVETFHRTFDDPLIEILKAFPPDELPDRLKNLGPATGDFVHKAADIIMRDMVNSVVGFAELDRILNGLIAVVKSRLGSGHGDEVRTGGAAETDVDYLMLDELSDDDAMRRAPMIGGKAKNLFYVRNYGLSVPQGAVFSARHTGDHEKYIDSRAFRSMLQEAVKKIEERTGTVFGGGEKPLFLSVRSGSYISMPGILSSILYCGMNRETASALIESSGSERLGWDSYRRFIEHYATVVYGLDVKMFEAIITAIMKSRGVAHREELNAVDMEKIVGLYREGLSQQGHTIPEDVYEQLRQSIKAIYQSWYAERALQFRRAMDVSEHWGTAVAIMQMISGNAEGSGASVFFTRKPSSLEKGIYGETREGATGDDLVSGKLLNRPLSKEQNVPGQRSLDETDPELFLMHEELAGEIDKALRGLPQEVEATYTRGPDGTRTIYVLQTRRMESYRGFTKKFQDVCRMESNIIGRGVGVHGGALSGIATFSSSLDRIRQLRRENGQPVILLRETASTDDVSLMPEINGIITAAGGATSHAAILAQKFGVTAVVGCSDMIIETDKNRERFARIGPHTITDGTALSIDGSTGLVYSGVCAFTEEQERR
jgi:pyruvate,orthophosphate dikinase